MQTMQNNGYAALASRKKKFCLFFAKIKEMEKQYPGLFFKELYLILFKKFLNNIYMNTMSNMEKRGWF